MPIPMRVFVHGNTINKILFEFQLFPPFPKCGVQSNNPNKNKNTNRKPDERGNNAMRQRRKRTCDGNPVCMINE